MCKLYCVLELPVIKPAQMELLDFTFNTPEENLACDEAMLEAAEIGLIGPVLRFWTPLQHFVVLGYSNRVTSEVKINTCQALNIPIYRRCTGGGTVLQGPGCLNYSLLLEINSQSPTASADTTNRYVMERHRVAIDKLLSKTNLFPKGSVQIGGITDLIINNMKFSGNAQRRKKRFLLFHGTFLTGLNLDLVEKVLQLPRKQPKYRANRSHLEFLINLPIPPEVIKTALIQLWRADSLVKNLPIDLITHLAATKYSNPEWTNKFW